MRVKVKNHTVLEDIILASGTIGKEAFNDLEIGIKDLIDFIYDTFPNYLIKFCIIEDTDAEIFDQDRFLDEIDYGILSNYIVESNLLKV